MTPTDEDARDNINRAPAPDNFEAVIQRLRNDAAQQKDESRKLLETAALSGVESWLNGMLNWYRAMEDQNTSRSHLETPNDT